MTNLSPSGAQAISVILDENEVFETSFESGENRPKSVVATETRRALPRGENLAF